MSTYTVNWLNLICFHENGMHTSFACEAFLYHLAHVAVVSLWEMLFICKLHGHLTGALHTFIQTGTAIDEWWMTRLNEWQCSNVMSGARYKKKHKKNRSCPWYLISFSETVVMSLTWAFIFFRYCTSDCRQSHTTVFSLKQHFCLFFFMAINTQSFKSLVFFLLCFSTYLPVMSRIRANKDKVSNLTITFSVWSLYVLPLYGLCPGPTV